VPDQKERADKFLEDLVDRPILARDLAEGIAND